MLWQGFFANFRKNWSVVGVRTISDNSAAVGVPAVACIPAVADLPSAVYICDVPFFVCRCSPDCCQFSSCELLLLLLHVLSLMLLVPLLTFCPALLLTSMMLPLSLLMLSYLMSMVPLLWMVYLHAFAGFTIFASAPAFVGATAVLLHKVDAHNVNVTGRVCYLT